MVKTKTLESCRHYWHIKSEDGYDHGICEICEMETKFPPDGKGGPIVIKPGKPLSNIRMHQFYERHKSEILNVIQKEGASAAKNRWHIPDSTMHGLLNKWGKRGTAIELEVASISQQPAIATSAKPAAELRGRPRTGELRNCLACGTQFYARGYKLDMGEGLFCSRSCASKQIPGPSLRPDVTFIGHLEMRIREIEDFVRELQNISDNTTMQLLRSRKLLDQYRVIMNIEADLIRSRMEQEAQNGGGKDHENHD